MMHPAIQQRKARRFLTGILALYGMQGLIVAQELTPRVEVATKPGAKWVAMETRTLDTLAGKNYIPEDTGLSPYGGMSSRREKATGFFHTAKVHDRWWLVDPEGGLFLHRGVSSVTRLNTAGAVSYTHMTLPPIFRVCCWFGVSVALQYATASLKL